MKTTGQRLFAPGRGHRPCHHPRRHGRRRPDLSGAAHSSDHSICRRQRQRRRHPHPARPDQQIDRAALHRREPAGRGRQYRDAGGRQSRPRRLHPGGHGLRAGGRPTRRYISDLGYEPEKDFEPITIVAHLPHRHRGEHEASGEVAGRTDRLCQGASEPAQLRLGRHRQLAAPFGAYFEQITGVKLTHVPYRNIAQYAPDLMAGDGAARLSVASQCPGPAPGRRRQGDRGRQQKRMAALPDVPTTAEAGLRTTSTPAGSPCWRRRARPNRSSTSSIRRSPPLSRTRRCGKNSPSKARSP